MGRPAPAPRSHRRRGRLLAAAAGTVLAAVLGFAGALGVTSVNAPAGGPGHGVHTDIQSWS